eukprot:TRINITY_DN10234_c0_g3_i1.p1 TRINITY_DN10234_c0_g3~~TRINITY_DN10234_c0_g3_i1.p1  ORF type:complete len:116 (-),score=26.73 TRINITY_DN10234_c0_g3_i1:2-349(-)
MSTQKKKKESKQKEETIEKKVNEEKTPKKGKHKEKFIDTLPDEFSNSEEEEGQEEKTVKIARVGYFQVKIRDNKWKPHYCVLIGGSFYWYKNSQATIPDGGINCLLYTSPSPRDS